MRRAIHAVAYAPMLWQTWVLGLLLIAVATHLHSAPPVQTMTVHPLR